MTAQTAAQRRAALVRRRKEAGLTEVRGLFLPPALHPTLKATARRMAKQHHPAINPDGPNCG